MVSFERMLVDKVTSSWNRQRDFVGSPAVNLTPVFMNTVLSETVECSKIWKSSLLRVVVLMYSVRKFSLALYHTKLGKGKHTFTKILFPESLKKSNI